MACVKTSTVTFAPTVTLGRSRTAEVTTRSKSRSTSSTSSAPRPCTTSVKRRVIADDPEDPLETAVVAPLPPLPPVPGVNHVVVQPAPMEVDPTTAERAATEEDAAPYANLLDDFLAIFQHEMRKQQEQVATMQDNMSQINARLDQRHEVVATDRDYDDCDYPDDNGDDGGGCGGGGDGGGRNRNTGISYAFHMCGLADKAIRLSEGIKRNRSQ
jgi:hypothetical protein